MTVEETYKDIKKKVRQLEGCRRPLPNDPLLPPTQEQIQREVDLTEEILELEEKARNTLREQQTL